MAQVALTATFTAAGPFTWTAPAGVTAVTVACTGAGGGGGNAGAASGSNGGGGGGGEAALEAAAPVTPGAVYAGTVGAGGAGQAAGGDTSFTADGGVVVYAHGGGAGGNGGPGGSGQAGAGGDGSVNSVSGAGGNGDVGNAGAANGGWTLVQQSAAQASAPNTVTNTLAAASTAGNLLVAVVSSTNAQAPTAPSGWGNSLTFSTGGAGTFVTTIFAYPSNPGGLTSFTFTVAPGTGTMWATVMEFTCPNVAQAGFGNAFGQATAGAVTSVTVSTGSNALAGDLVIAAAFEDLSSAAAITWTDPPGFTEASGLLTGSNANHSYAAYQLAAPAAGTQTATITSSATAAANGWAGGLLTFSVPSAGGGGGGAAGVSAAQSFPGGNAVGPVAGAASGGTFPGGAGGAGSTSGAGPGSNGSAPGGGGGGALSTGTGRSGGAGGNGQVVITWTQPDPVTLTANTSGGAWTFTAPSGATAVNAQAWGAGASGFLPQGTVSGAIQGRAGATVWQVYGLTNKAQRVQAANIFDGYVGIPLALGAQKVYYNETGSDSIAQYVSVNSPQPVGLLAAAGCQVVLCPKANRSYATGTDDFAALQSAVADISSHIGAANLIVVLWQECTDQWFPSAAAYRAYWDHYVPAIPSNVKVCVDVGAGPGLAADQAYAQAVLNSTVRKPDIVAVDVYDSSYHNGRNYLTYPSSDPNYPGIADIADIAGVPFGIYEWGQSASASYPTAEPDPNWHDYIYGAHGLLTVIQARIAAGKPLSHVMYYGGAGPGNNDIESNSDFRIQAMLDIYAAMTGAAGGTAGGAGGGGGEYAAESSLAITDSRVYALAVGAGGAGGASGGNSTVAGDSVTVTGHGGSAATVTTAGGAGGTGSANSTHFSGGAGGAGGGTNGGGGGGGGSGGTAAGGNAGGAGTPVAGGAGGTAVTGGGKGGFGAKPAVSGFAGGAPGGGGGGGGASALATGPGADGQLVLSGFTIHPAGPASFALAPVGLAGTGNVSVSTLALAPVALSGTAAASMIAFVQQGPTATGTFTLTTPSTAGNTLIARVVQSTQTATTPPSGAWQLVAAQNTGGATGRAEMWILPGNFNPGGISSVAWTGGTALRGYVAEYSCPAGYLIVGDGTPGTASGTTPVTSFPVSTSGANLGGDAALALFLDQFSVNPTGSSFTTPSGWTRETFVQASVPDCYVGYYKLGLNATTQSVTGTFSTSTSQVGWAAILATFTAVPLNTSTGSLALAPLALAGTGNAVVGPNQVATSGGLALAPLAFQSPSQAAYFPGHALPVKVEILVNGVWTDITSYVYTRDGINITGRGRPDEASTPQPTQVTLTLNNTDESFSPQNPASQYFPYLVRNTQIRISVVNAVTAQGAWYTGYRFWGEVPAWPPQWNTAGTDVYVSITACGVLQRLRQSKFSASPLARYYATQVNAFLGSAQSFTNNLVPAGYWPCEDASSATSFASALPGGFAMTWTGTPGLSADTSVAGSAPFAQLNSSAWTGTPGAFSAGGQTWGTPGTYTWLCPAGVTTIKAECWGAGGGGSGGSNASGGGGGGGEYAAEPNLAVTPGKTYTLVVGAGASGGAGTFSSTPNSGGNGASSTFSGDTITVRAHGGIGGGPGGTGQHGGGQGATGGPGGTGSTNTTHFRGGGGGGSSSSSGFGGCGGGGSAGNAAAGLTGGANTGTTGGNGASARPGGGPGGMGGTGATAAQGNTATPGLMPFPGPGGGGGGGGFNGFNNFSKPGGAGQAGQVTISFGQTPMPNANVLRFVLDVPSGGGTDGACMAQALTSGTVADFHVLYHTGGNLELVGKSGTGATLFDSGSKAAGANGQPLLVSAELTQNTPTQIKWRLFTITPGATAATLTASGTITGTLGSVTSVKTNSLSPAETTAVGIGHITMQYAVDPLLNLAPAFAAYSGELAATRIARLCKEQRIPLALIGSAPDTPQMGPQPTGLLSDLLQDCENADLGQVYERRDVFGLGYRTRVSLQNQSPVVVLSHTGGQLAQNLQPTDDDQLTRNDVLATRASVTTITKAGITTFTATSGTTYEAVQATGTMSVQDPPNGVGLYQYPVTVNLFADSQLAPYATWVLTLGTVDEFRYPVITTDLRRPQCADVTFTNMAKLDVGDYLQIVSPAAWLPQIPINQLAFGFAETIGWNSWVIAVNAVPEDPYGGQSLPTW